MKRVLMILCLLVVAIPVVAQTNSEIYQALIQQGRQKGESVRDLEIMYRFDVACDYDNPVVRGFAMGTAKPAQSNTITIAQVCNIFDAVKPPYWKYFPDPYGVFDTIAKASESVTLGLKGDCDDFAVLVATCIRAIGGACRIFVAEATPFGHAFAAVYIGEKASAEEIGEYIRQRYNVEDVYVRISEGKWYWLVLDWDGTPPYPGHRPVVDVDKASHAFSVPIYSIAAESAGVPLPVPAVPPGPTAPDAGGFYIVPYLYP